MSRPRLVPGQPIAVTLSGGGTRLYAHLGVLLACEELGLPVRQVLGVSGGALVGAAYAALGAEATRALLREIPVARLKRWAWLRNRGIWDNGAIKEVLERNGVTWRAAADRGIDLHLGVAALEPGLTLVWDGARSPVTLAEAARISASIPFLWGYTAMPADAIMWPPMPPDAVLPAVVTLADGGCSEMALPAPHLPYVASNVAFRGYRETPIGGWLDQLAQILAVYQYRTMDAALEGAAAVVKHKRCRALGWLDDFTPAEIDTLIDDARIEALEVLRQALAG